MLGFFDNLTTSHGMWCLFLLLYAGLPDEACMDEAEAGTS